MGNQLKQILKFLKLGREQGQSLVEMMIFTPLLIFFLIGVFEVGSALRTYLVMVNVNREITRFSVRPGYLNFANVDPDLTDEENAEIIFDRVYDWVSTALTGQYELNWSEADEDGDGYADGNTTMIISHLVADTGIPCEDINDCDCDEFIDAYNNGTTYANDFKYDDVFIHPGLPNQGFQAARFGPATTITGDKPTRLDYEALLEELAANNNKFNCEIMKKGGVASANNVIVTEIYYDQPQLFGFPFISNPYTDPVELYTHTTMRLIGAARSLGTTAGNLTDGINTYGPICFAYPITVKRSVIEGATPGQTIDIFEGAGPSNFGWLAWSPAGDDENYINMELNYPQMSINDYTDPSDGDENLKIGDYVTSLTGVANSDDNRDILHNLAGQEIIIPVWDDVSAGGFQTFPNTFDPPPMTLSAYRVYKFVRVTILTGTAPDGGDPVDLDQKEVWATYEGIDTTCQ
jgi:hypothetical protein